MRSNKLSVNRYLGGNRAPRNAAQTSPRAPDDILGLRTIWTLDIMNERAAWQPLPNFYLPFIRYWGGIITTWDY
jgi:hypothetical protein